MNARDEQLSKAEELFVEVFEDRKDQRSIEYKRGVMAALINHFAGIGIGDNCPYKAGTAEFDAFDAGLSEGHRIWRAYLATVSFRGDPEEEMRDATPSELRMVSYDLNAAEDENKSLITI